VIDHRFAVLGALISLIGSGGYAIDTLRGRTQPNRITWALWALAPSIAFAAELSEHAGLGSLMTFAVGFGPLMVTIASFLNRKAYWRLTRFDALCGCLSVGALAMWALTGKGDVAIAFSILADLWAGIPTLYKSHRHPESESVKAFLGGVAGATITLLALQPGGWAFAGYAFPLYILVFDACVSGLILAPRVRARRSGRTDQEPIHGEILS